MVLLLAAAAAVSQTEPRSDFAARSQYTYVAPIMAIRVPIMAIRVPIMAIRVRATH